MAPGYNVIAEAEAQPCPKTRRLRSKKGLKYFIQYLFRDTVSIIGNAYLDPVIAYFFRCYGDRCLITGDILLLFFTHRIKGIVDQVQQHPSDILVYNVNLSNAIVKISFKFRIE